MCNLNSAAPSLSSLPLIWELVKRLRGCFSLTLMYPDHWVHLCFPNGNLTDISVLYTKSFTPTDLWWAKLFLLSTKDIHGGKTQEAILSCWEWGKHSFPPELNRFPELLWERCPQSNFLPMVRAVLRGCRGSLCSKQWMRFPLLMYFIWVDLAWQGPRGGGRAVGAGD